ncbi:hypothetical protein NIES4102_22160 [Chondrocystis sp. NIES-4102]|nr:hypothetical protein NIES4102_22160 [Chondrocystis sp. NIES-4102]
MRFCFVIESFYCNTGSLLSNRLSNNSLVEMTSNSNLNDIDIFIGSFLSFNQLSLDSQFVDALFIKGELALAGGLLFKTNDVSIGASCCADFQDWINIVKDVKRKISPWMGHDPSPWFEFKDENIILWSNEGKLNHHNTIMFTQQEFDYELLEAKKELYCFLNIFKLWAKKNYDINPERLFAGIQNYLLI